MKLRTVLVVCLTAMSSLVIIISDSRLSIQDLNSETIFRDLTSGSRYEKSEPQEEASEPSLTDTKSGFTELTSEQILKDMTSESESRNEISETNIRDENSASRKRRIYISMGLCWHRHSHLYNKVHFPYEEAAR